MKEQHIIALLFARDEQALAQLSSKYTALCRKIARGILGSEEDVQECVSDTFLAVWNRIPPENPQSLTAYISRIARNLACNRLDYNTAAIRDGKVITGTSAGCATAFGLELIRALKGDDIAETVRQQIVIR